MTETKINNFREYLENSIKALKKIGDENSFTEGAIFGFEQVLSAFNFTFEKDGEDDE